MKSWKFKTTAKFPAKGALGLWIGLMVFAALAGGCAEGDDTEKPEISGTRDDFFNTTHVIGPGLWTQTFQDGGQFIFHIKEFDNSADFLLAQNDGANAFSPNLFSRFDWFFSQFDLFYCQSIFDALDLATARAASADRNNLVSGCGGGFRWSELVLQSIE